ncbi:SRPBCC domain-containing protein [Pseudonocardia xinjiangensis]|uniref:SRPBCC domain-containing protein n=1 Tax=Pseudonocardia xinjiangensis TaxID=75289 RepID=UPI003D8EF5F4
MYSTQVSRHVRAPRSEVYRALLDADAIARWRVPTGMSSQVHDFDAREGGSFRVSLTHLLRHGRVDLPTPPVCGAVSRGRPRCATEGRAG